MIGMVVDTLTNGRRRAPRVVVAQRVIDKMVRGALLYPDEETAEAMIGLVIPREGSPDPDFYVLDTIAPDQADTERQRYMVEQGDDWQDLVMYWLELNWRRFRERRRESYGSALAAKWDAPLRYLGDWHKQPGTMFEPSMGDLMTARNILRDDENDMPHLLAAIVTVFPAELDIAPQEFDLLASHDDGSRVRMSFWYLARRMADFTGAKVTVMASDLLPNIPPLSWNLKDRERFQLEHDLLADAGLAVSVNPWDADGVPPLEVCLLVARMGSRRVFFLVTDADYPHTPPRIRVASTRHVSEAEDYFAALWESSRELTADDLPPDWAWKPGMFLVDVVQAVEAHQAESAAS